jgi:hypothetical protein
MDAAFERELNAPPAKRWEHDPNPLVGELISRYTYEGEFDPVDVLVIQPEGSDVAFSVMCGRATLRSFAEEKDPKVGGTVGIKFAGVQTSQRNAKEYALYNAAYRPPTPVSEVKAQLTDESDDEPPF